MKPPTWMIVLPAAGVAVLIAAAGFLLQGGWTQEGALAATRLTARWSFPWFLAAWTASSVAGLWPGGWRTALLRRRRAVGLAFAANHGVHLVCILVATLGFGHQVPAITIGAGGTVYVFIALMAATSSDAAVRWMGAARWKLLHAVGGWAVLVVFTNSYVGRIGEKPWLAIPAVGLIALALVLRAGAWFKRHRRAQAA